MAAWANLSNGWNRLKEFIRDIETRMLTAFHSYAQSNDLRLPKSKPA